MTGRLAGKSALVTGASAGIGRACALALAAEGAEVIATGRRSDALAALIDEIEAAGGRARAIAGDLNTASFLPELAKQAATADLFVNNAGILVYAPFIELPAADIDAMVQTNIVAALKLMQLVASAMAARGRGHVIVITSGAARRAVPLGLVYSATKAAMSAAARTLRVELQDRGIKVTEIAPGTVDTEIRRNSSHPAFQAKMQARRFAPLSVDDVAAAVVYAATTSGVCSADLIEMRPRQTTER